MLSGSVLTILLTDDSMLVHQTANYQLHYTEWYGILGFNVPLHYTEVIFSGLCGITAEMLKASGNLGIQWLTGVIKQVWQSGLIPSDWKKGIILPIYKGKGSPKDCRNYRGITLCSGQGIRHSTAKQSSRPASCTSQNGAEWVHAWSVND